MKSTRPLKWSDVRLLYRYRKQAVSLRAVRRAIGGPGLLSLAWLALLSPSGGVAAVIDELPQIPLVGVAEVNADNSLMEMAYLAPENHIAGVSLSPLVEGFAAAPAFQGMRAITAEAPLEADWLDSLREAGFQIVERRQVWQVVASRERTQGGGWHYPSPDGRQRAERLYHNLTPPLVRLARPNPAISPTALVYLEKGDVRGLAQWAAVGRRVWVEPLLDPDVRDPRQALGDLVAALPAGEVFISLPLAQAWTSAVLADLGARPGEAYASLVRWRARTVEATDPAVVPVAADILVPHV